jgi:hypothetical protein
VRLRSSLFRKVPLYWFVFRSNVSGQPVGAIFKGGIFKGEDGTERLFINVTTNYKVTLHNIPENR